MTFNSLVFFAFFAVVLLLYFRLGVRGQNRLAIVAGSVFYGAFDWRFLGLLYLSAVVDYTVGRHLETTENESRRKRLVAISLATQLGILAFFKYVGFFVDSAAGFIHSLGFTADIPTLNILLPVGISFYTFQTLAYVITVYRRQMPAERDFVTFGSFVSWFPQLVAGPIERPQSLLPQLRVRRDLPDAPVLESGGWLIFQGLVKKVMIADAVAPAVNRVFANPELFGWPALVLATVGFAVQVYGDFSGYSDCARGVSRILGVELRRNFEQPFLSRNMQEFWQRWHTSLGWWFLEFVGRPLGKVRRGARWSAFTTLVIFALIGLWHGPAWTFVFWGVLNGVCVVIWRRRPIPKNQDRDRVRWSESPRILMTFAIFCAGGIFFRAGSFADAFTVLRRVLTLRGGLGPGAEGALIPLMTLVVIGLDVWERRRRIEAIEARGQRPALGGVATPEEAAAESLIAPLGAISAGALVGLALVAVVVFSGSVPTPFVYFQF